MASTGLPSRLKKLALLLTAGPLLLSAHEASAQMISITASPSSQMVAAGGNFSVALTLSVPAGSGPDDVAAYDLYLVTSVANTGYFSITAATPDGPFDSFGPDDSGGDPLSNDTGSGYVRNGMSQGFSGAAQSVPFSNLALETLAFTVAANTPAGTYMFQTSTTGTAGDQYSDVSDSSGLGVYEVTSPGTFEIMVVPEPSAFVVLCAGVLGGSLVLLNRKRCDPLVRSVGE